MLPICFKYACVWGLCMIDMSAVVYFSAGVNMETDKRRS